MQNGQFTLESKHIVTGKIMEAMCQLMELVQTDYQNNWGIWRSEKDRANQAISLAIYRLEQISKELETHDARN